ncbi:oxygenase MpaB family protein [Streptomyces sp. AK02-01A]|uniref:oxygenase MpaB family protein n=1 Tax=Streptomyces sp. AK02-01A TaxID=3028648 RepID=UPI0029A9EA9F|nr:oxygenase MpaB family protein [Streptomyces sp. AK02-01A]MDX3854509.1 oxygenase MpaB family protein [Streptomyces sp. AK02-01A]
MDGTESRPGAGEGPADPGLFGPGSVTWQLHGDPMMWIAGIRALYLQALHPRAVRGVTQNSDFRADAWGRLRRTADFVGTISYGTTEAAERAGARVRRIHRLLRATDPVTGERYGVDEPALLLWVHCAEVDSYLRVVRRSGIRLSDAQADRYAAEHRESARLVGLDPDLVPATTGELAGYFDTTRPELECGAEAREVDDFLRRPPVPAPLVPARELLWRRVAALAYQALPPYAHVLYGRPAPAPETVTRRLTAAGELLRRVPARVRWQLPPKHILRAMARLGPDTRPDPYTLHSRAAILDDPGRTRPDNGGDSTRWRTPG